ncbi:MAG TPA: hypothetical protein VF530_21430 [Planctomycetota bacterium]
MSAARKLAVVALVLALAVWLVRGRGGDSEEPVVELGRDVNECTENLRAIHAGFLRHAQRTGGALPEGAGVAVLGALVAEGDLPDTPAVRAQLTCPGPGAHPVSAVDFRRPEALGGADSAYAVRDLMDFPLARFPAGGGASEALVACDNARGMNHAGCMNVLYTDGSVRTFTLPQEIERGTLPPGTRTIPVGPGSPLPDLRVLSPD